MAAPPARRLDEWWRGGSLAEASSRGHVLVVRGTWCVVRVDGGSLAHPLGARGDN